MGPTKGVRVSDAVLLTRLDGPVLTLTLNRPHRRNAIDRALWDALGEALHRATVDEAVRAVVVTGAGGAFCGGADLDPAARGADAEHPTRLMRRINDVALALHELPVPSVAVVDGVAVGAGWNLALGCDLVVATPAARFSQIFARRGLSVDFGGTWLLPRLVGMQQAKRLALLAETIGAEEAHALGLVTWVVDGDELPAFVADIAGRLADGPPVALARDKAMLPAATRSSFAEALDAEATSQAINFVTDAPEGIAAFVERRDAGFDGRWRFERT
ncbi:Enoyl-CoA hydratase [Pseudonocardia sp. Ae717_Ps2]|uniref:enoyl-CoA hydratase/isomerase family protein n=1 Tax=Pseudonocardia sp. Ae717_Ps2 TaxID=1885573 RepID=UPI00094A9CEC|nr:enoyl-CoA hydratase-related protein [Pseudonocardia sp. Ae717_Ps2]OLM31502.1 Enoyl-CoA hydratase [Pseudonocardia sp. Ae717_Ps2]